jgi:S-adenosylmethionine hydrolase
LQAETWFTFEPVYINNTQYVDYQCIEMESKTIMGRSQNSFIKKQKENKRELKKKEKEAKKKERQENSLKGGDLDDMLAYVDEFGNITSEAPGTKQNEDDKELQP